jgi:hypothetical protein
VTRNGRSLRAALIVALLGVTTLVLIDRACSDEVTLSVGGTASSGLGEGAYSPLARLSGSTGRLLLAGTFDYSHKVENGRGWIGGLDLELHATPWLIVGADYRHRNGGTWVKDVGFARAGLAAGQSAIVYRHELFTRSAQSNRVRALELIGRRDIGAGFFVRALLSGVSSVDYSGQRRFGTYSQIAFGRAWRAR